MANGWFRLYGEFATDPKVQMMKEANQRRLIMLFCLRSCNVSVTLHDDEVTFQLRITPDEWQATKAEFIRLGFIDEGNNLLNWDKRQYISDSSTARVAKHRKKQKKQVKQACNVSVTPPDSEPETESEPDSDSQSDSDSYSDSDKNQPTASMPTKNQVISFGHKNGLDLVEFFDFYDERNWHVGEGDVREPVKNWQKLARAWSKRRKSKAFDNVVGGSFSKTEDETPWHHNLGD